MSISTELLKNSSLCSNYHAQHGIRIRYDEYADENLTLSFEALQSYTDYVQKFACPTCEVLLLGMNPGPFGMAQTGVPFGDVVTVTHWLRIRDWADGEIPVKLPLQHPRRPLKGQRSTKVERSGQRLWSLVKNRWALPHDFFGRFFVYNYCPLSFMSSQGSNITPDKIKTVERKPLEIECDKALMEVLQVISQSRLLVHHSTIEVCRNSQALRLHPDSRK